MPNFVKKHPAISQTVLAMIIGGGMVAPMVAGVVPSDSMFLLVAAYSASLAGVILTAIVSGKGGLREMSGRLLIWGSALGGGFLPCLPLPPCTWGGWSWATY